MKGPGVDLHTIPNLATQPKTTHHVAMLLQYLPPQGASPTERQPPESPS